MLIIKKYYIIFLLIIGGFSKSTFAQRIHWMTWEEAVEKSKIEKRKIMIDVYTDWCSWCKEMDKTTFSNEHIVNYVNDVYYAVKLNAQQKDDLIYQDKVYSYVERGVSSYHELAATIMGGKLKYPTIVFLDEDFQVIQSIPGYREPIELELILTYFGDNFHTKKPWSSFKRDNQNSLLNKAQLNILQKKN